MNKSPLAKTLLALTMGLCLAHIAMAACHSGADYKSASMLATQGKLYTAIEYYEQYSLECGLSPRVLLELGELWNQLDKRDKAIQYWLKALQEYPLPASVELNTKLKIINAKLSLEKKWLADLSANYRLTHREPQASNEQYMAVHISAAYSDEPKNFNGYAARIKYKAALSGHNYQYTDDTLNYSKLQTKLESSVDIGKLSTTTGVNFTFLDNETQTQLYLEPGLTHSIWSSAVYVGYSPDLKTLRIEPAFYRPLGAGTWFTGLDFSNSAGTTLEFDSLWMLYNWQTSGSVILLPQLSATYGIELKNIQLSGQLTYPIKDHWLLSGNIETDFGSSENWSIASTLTFRAPLLK